MVNNVSKNNFEIIKGTTVEELILIYKNDVELYKLKPNEKIIFGIKKHYNDKSYAVIKTLTYNNEFEDGYLLSIAPEDTESLIAGSFYYDVGIQNIDTGSYQMIIPLSICNIIPSVTSKEEQEEQSE